MHGPTCIFRANLMPFSLQSGRNPYHVNPLNAAPEIYNPADPVSGMAAMPRNMTGMAMKMSAGGYKTHMFGKWDVVIRAANSRGPGGPTGPLRAPSRTPWIPSR